ncbi:hypothetical protein HY635_02315 [Candidatus Uhrbacteria bacterium]|nr:hypothetical protein [Candidatus Uhrbacteria bacterium]
MRQVSGINWRPYHGGARGTKVPGDPNAPATRRWLVWLLRRFFWKKVVVFAPQASPHTAYRIGFRTAWGDAFVLDRMSTDAQFAMRLGQEDCTFFALSRHGETEIPLHGVAITRLDDPHYKDTPLY